MSSRREILGYEPYITQKNDTFDLIAYRHYGNEMLASLILQENIHHADTLIFEAGILLYLPVIDEMEIEDSLPPWRKVDKEE